MARVMVLAAGYGTRLRPLTDVLPKPLVPVGDSCPLGLIVEQLAAQGYREAVFNTHYQPEAFRPFVEQARRRWGAELHVSHESKILGTAGGVRKALGHLQTPCVIYNGDITTQLKVAPLLAMAGSHALTLLVAPAQGGQGTVGLDACGRVVRVRGESFGDEVSGADYIGVMACGADAFSLLPDQGCTIGDVCLPLLRQGHSVSSLEHTAPWHDVGSVQGYLAANLGWLAATARSEFVAPSARIGAVELDGSVVLQGAVVTGAGALTRCVVWPGERVAAPAEDSVFFGRGRVLRITPAT